MSEVEKKVEEDVPPSEAPPAVPTGEEPAQDPTAAPAAPEGNGNAKKEKVKKTKEPIDPRQDPIGWLKSIASTGVHKLNFTVLDWAQKVAVPDESQRQPLPGKNELVTRNQFLDFLRDGQLLAKLANVLQPGAVETVHEGDAAKQKENQEANINGFIAFAKDKFGLTDEQVFSAEDLLAKGKAGYTNVFNTIVAVATQVKDKFDKDGLDFEALTAAAQQAQKPIVAAILNFFRRARPQSSPKIKAEEADENQKAAAAGANGAQEPPAAGDVEETMELKKVEQPAQSGPTAIAAN